MFGAFRSDNPGMLNDLQDEVNRIIQRFWHGGVNTPPFDGQDWAPPWDVYEYNDRFVATIEVAGLDSDTIDITYSGQVLSVKGNKPATRCESSVGCLRRERRAGSFNRTIQLPEPIDADRIKAGCHEGLLEVVLPKKVDPSKRTVKVEVG